MDTPLSDAEYDQLESILNGFKNERAMNLEEVDGFFAALICSPELTPPSLYLQEIWGGEMSDEDAFQDQQEAQDFMSLIMRHWNAVVKKLSDEEVFLPLLFEDSEGNTKGNDWGNGFIRGMQLHWGDWTELMEDEKNGGALIPILALAYENHPDPEMHSYKGPVTEERREDLITGLSVGTMGIYKYFETQRHEMASRATEHTFRRDSPKIGRNDPCPCGSGRKFKRCCGDVTLN